MRKILPLFLIIILSGCKKESDEAPDYNCNCRPFGKNIISFSINQASSFYPFETTGHRWGYLDVNGDTAISPQFAGTYLFSNHRGMVVADNSGMQFAGFIDETGKYAIQPHYRYLVDAFFSEEGLIPMGNKDNLLIGYIDNNGGQRVPFLYDYGSNYHEGVAIVLSGNYVGAIDVNGKVIVPIKLYALGVFSEGLAFAMEYGGKKAGYIDTTGKFKFHGDYSLGTVFMYGKAAVMINDKVGFIDSTGNLVIPAMYTDASVFSENLAAVQYEGKWGFINNMGEWAIDPQFDDVNGGFCNGFVPVKKNGEWGYINRDGSLVIPYQFDDAAPFYCDLAQVWFMDATTGYINKEGKLIYHGKSSSGVKKEKKMIADHFKEFTIFAPLADARL